MGLATINIKFQADLRGFSTEMQNSMRRIGAFGNQMKAVGQGMSTYLTLPIVAAGAAAIKFASDYDESINKVDVAFKGSASGVKEFAKTTLESFGIAEGTALELASTYGDMGTSLGLSTEKASKMSTSLVGLAGDLSSFKNISIDIANTALAGIFTGETESLKKLGIVMTEANLQNFAYSRGLKIKISDMDQASKVNLRYAYIMSVTKNAQGDFARTGGGAANQMRIFQESLKQVAQQFGSIMIPAFTKAIVYVNGLVKAFGNLSQGTKETIIVVAAVVSAMGPMLTVFGSMLTFVPNLITKFNALRTSLIGLNAVIIANPYAAAAVAIGLIAAATYAWYVNSDRAQNSQKALNNAVADGNKQAETEIGTLDKLYASATNVKLSVDSRKEAVAKLQELYPAYFQNLDAENIKNGKAVGIYNELRNAIFNKARAVAVDLELQKRANDRIEKELQLRDDISKTEDEILRLKKGSNEIVLQEANASEKTLKVTISKAEAIAAQTKLLKQQQANLANYNNANRGADEALFKAKEVYSGKTVKLTENEKLAQKLAADAAAVELAKVGKASDELVAKSGSIAFFEKQIEGLQKLQKNIPVTNTAWKTYENQIDAIKAKIDALQNTGIKISKPQIPEGVDYQGPDLNITYYEDQIARYRELQSKFSTNNEEGRLKYQEYASRISETEIIIQDIQGVDKFVESTAKIKAEFLDLKEMVNSAVKGLAESAAIGMGEAIGGILSGTTGVGDAMKGMMVLIGGFMKDLGKSLITAGLAAVTFKKLLAQPWLAVAAGIALVALGTVVQNKFNAGPKGYANGGIVGGQSYYGDKIMARVNSAEMISNTDQQKRIWGAMNGGSSSTTIIPDIRIQGSDLLVVFERAQNRKNRIG